MSNAMVYRFFCCCFYVWSFLEDSLPVYFGWPGTCNNPPVSASQELKSQVCTTIPDSHLYSD